MGVVYDAHRTMWRKYHTASAGSQGSNEFSPEFVFNLTKGLSADYSTAA
jgi:hypothetical protein